MLQTATYYTGQNLILSHLGMAEPVTKNPDENLHCILNVSYCLGQESDGNPYLPQILFIYLFLEPKPGYLISLKLLSLPRAGIGRKLLSFLIRL